ncbi:hypothetical protein [Runella limosa]|uniref:hypothetical protein n=1 Tax=Runella limosa TaxID=370978 RepID=UPI00055F4916|nr:hypothetical protein [Runella limosa]
MESPEKSPILVKLDSNNESMQILAQTLIQGAGEIALKIVSEKNKSEIEIAKIESEDEKRRLEHEKQLVEAELKTDLRNKITAAVAIGIALACYILLKIFADISSDIVAILSSIIATSIASVYKISGNFYKRSKPLDEHL